jgi:hypothetical protein
MRNPFIPSRSPVCRAADTFLISSVVVAGVVAAILSLAHQMWSSL